MGTQFTAPGYTFDPVTSTWRQTGAPVPSSNPFLNTVAAQGAQPPAYQITDPNTNPFGPVLGSTLPTNTNFVNTGTPATTTPPPGTTPPPAGTTPPPGTTAPTGPTAKAVATVPPLDTPPNVGLPGMQGGGYPTVGNPTGMPYGAGAVGGFPIDPATGLPNWKYNPSNNVGDILANAQGYAYTQGGELMANYGTLMAQQQQRAGQLGGVGDSMYAFLQANPGYTPAQAQAIMNQPGLDALQWNQGMADQNFLTGDEQTAIQGDPYAAYRGYAQTASIPQFDAQGNPILDAQGNQVMQSQADYLNQLSRQYQGTVQGMYDTGATALGGALGTMGTGLSNAIDPSKLGLSGQFTQNYNWTPEDSQNIINAAGRNVGEQTAAIQDQLQRQAAAAGSNAPLALSAALARQRQTGDVAGADAMTQAAIQAKQQELLVQQTLEQMRLGTAQDISSRQMQEATTMGQSDIAANEYLTSGRAAAGLQTGQEQITEQNTIAGQEANLTQAGELAAQQRAQALAQNRQQISQANQAQQFSRGSYIDQAASQRATQEATATRADQTQARQDVRNEEQTAYNESNSAMAGQLQAFSGVTGAGQASDANAIRAAQLPTTLDKEIGAGATALSAMGDIFTKPTKARIGERGPEVVIKLKHGGGGPMSYRRRNEAAYA